MCVASQAVVEVYSGGLVCSGASGDSMLESDQLDKETNSISSLSTCCRGLEKGLSFCLCKGGSDGDSGGGGGGGGGDNDRSGGGGGTLDDVRELGTNPAKVAPCLPLIIVPSLSMRASWLEIPTRDLSRIPRRPEPRPLGPGAGALT